MWIHVEHLGTAVLQGAARTGGCTVDLQCLIEVKLGIANVTGCFSGYRHRQFHRLLRRGVAFVPLSQPEKGAKCRRKRGGEVK